MSKEAQLLELVYGEGFGDGRRVPRSERKAHDLQKLHQGHHEILGMKLLGFSQKEIARKTGYTEVAISLILGSRLAMLKLNQMRLARDGKTLDVAKKIHEELVPKAIAVYERILNAEEGNGEGIGIGLQKRTADVIVKDLAGLAAPKEVRVSGHMTHETLERITLRGAEVARECGLLAPAEDAEIIEDSVQTEGSDVGTREEIGRAASEAP